MASKTLTYAPVLEPDGRGVIGFEIGSHYCVQYVCYVIPGLMKIF